MDHVEVFGVAPISSSTWFRDASPAVLSSTVSSTAPGYRDSPSMSAALASG